MLTTKAPLREKMTLFWHDHFATSIQKVRQPVLLVKQNDLFRDHAFGNFRELTQQVVRDPAMMLYLDTQRSSKAKPNENFARELGAKFGIRGLPTLMIFKNGNVEATKVGALSKSQLIAFIDSNL
jgi:uncharacterized protein (DUF1800 family)